MKHLITLFIAFLVISCSTANSVNINNFYKPIDDSILLRYSFIDGYVGPASSKSSTASSTEAKTYTINHFGYKVCWSTATCNPAWVSWTLTTSMLNSKYSRGNTFYADPALPKKYQVESCEYSGSGYDRGHLCPAADMEYNKVALQNSFYMSNICPQVPVFNRVYWLKLENACRKWVKQEDTLYIVAGPYYDDSITVIANRKHTIHVPTGFFKCVMSLRKGHEKAIGFIYQNTSKPQSMEYCAVSVDSVEHLTNFNFYQSVPDSLQNSLEANFNLDDWGN